MTGKRPPNQLTTATRYYCNECQCSYTRADKLDKHILRHHPAEDPIPVPKPMHPSQMVFLCSEISCWTPYAESMITYECEHIKAQRLQQLDKWKAYMKYRLSECANKDA